MRCPICDKTFQPADTTAAPFCSERCRTIDLGRWLGETYSMPVESEASAEDFDELDERRANGRRPADADE